MVLARNFCFNTFKAVIRFSHSDGRVLVPSWVRLPENFDNVVPPPSGQRLLPELPKSPYGDRKGIEDLKYITKRLIEIRGPELYRNYLIHEQYGIAAVTGGMLQYKHLELIRTRVNKLLHEYELFKDAFAVWRVDAPWLPRPQKSKGSKMGGGKSKVHHFVTPVRSGRILFEFGGQIVEDQARQAIECLAERVPFEARFVSQVMLLEEKENEMIARRNNKNRFTPDFCMKWNMHNCSEHLSPYDYVWGGKYR